MQGRRARWGENEYGGCSSASPRLDEIIMVRRHVKAIKRSGQQRSRRRAEPTDRVHDVNYEVLTRQSQLTSGAPRKAVPTEENELQTCG